MHQQQPSAPRGLLLVSNPHAGGTDDQTLADVTAVWEAAGVRVVHHELDAGDDGRDAVLARCLEDEQVDRLAVAGGDGTLHLTLAALLAEGAEVLARRPVGLVPLGTGNDLARTLGLPLEPQPAARVVLEGQPRPMDLLVSDDGLVAMNAAHAGVGALATQRGQSAKGLLGPLGYAVGAVLAGATATGWPVTVDVDGQVVATPEGPVLMVGLAVGRTIGGGTPLAPDASPDDGLADVVLVGATGPIARVDYARRLRHGDHPDRDDVVVLRGRTVRVDAGDAPLNVDGELLGEAGSRTWTVLPHAWTAVAPAGA